MSAFVLVTKFAFAYLSVCACVGHPLNSRGVVVLLLTPPTVICLPACLLCPVLSVLLRCLGPCLFIWLNSSAPHATLCLSLSLPYATMGKRENRKNAKLLKSLMGQLSLNDSANTSSSSSKSSTSGTITRFLLDPSHPFYWHLSNRENRPTDDEDSSPVPNSDPSDQEGSNPGPSATSARTSTTSTTTHTPLIVIKRRKSKKRKKDKKRKHRNHARTADLSSSATSATAANHANRPSTLAKINHNRKVQRRNGRKLRRSIMKRRVVNTILASDLSQLSLS